MNRDFTRYQVLPSLDALLVSVKPSKVAVDAGAPSYCALFQGFETRIGSANSLPNAQRRDEEKSAVRPAQGQQLKFLRT